MRRPVDPGAARAARMLSDAAHATLFSDASTPELGLKTPPVVGVSSMLPVLDDDLPLAASADRIKRGVPTNLDTCLQATAKALALKLRDASLNWMAEVLRAEYKRTYGDECPYDEKELVDWGYFTGYRLAGLMVPDAPDNLRYFVIIQGDRKVAGLELNVREFELVKE